MEQNSSCSIVLLIHLYRGFESGKSLAEPEIFQMSKRSKSKNTKATPAISRRPAAATLHADVKKLNSQAALAKQIKPARSDNDESAAKANGKKPVAALSEAVLTQATKTKPTGLHASSNPASPKLEDALAAVAAIPEKLATVSFGSTKSEDTTESAPLPPQTDVTKIASPWDYSAKIFSIGQANTHCVTEYAKRYATAKTPQDIMAITSDFYKEQGRLFKQHSEDILKMLSL